MQILERYRNSSREPLFLPCPLPPGNSSAGSLKRRVKPLQATHFAQLFPLCCRFACIFSNLSELSGLSLHGRSQKSRIKHELCNCFNPYNRFGVKSSVQSVAYSKRTISFFPVVFVVACALPAFLASGDEGAVANNDLFFTNSDGTALIFSNAFETPALHASGADLVPVKAPLFDEPSSLPTSGDNNFIYRLVHRLIPGDSPRDPPPADINLPGPDTANFPNSPFTLQKGRSYIESSPIVMSRAGPGTPQTWAWSFLMRTGLTDDCEFRVFSGGPVVVGPIDGDPSYSGFAPLVFDLKIHLWGEEDWLYYPSVGLETFLSTNLASKPFQVGNQPGLSILVAHNFPGDILLEWNFGYFGTNDPDALDTLSESYLGVSWALQKQLSKKLAVFYQGFYNGANGNFFPADLVSGLGGYWSATQRLGLFASYNWSLDKMGSPFGGYSGFAYAY